MLIFAGLFFFVYWRGLAGMPGRLLFGGTLAIARQTSERKRFKMNIEINAFHFHLYVEVKWN